MIFAKTCLLWGREGAKNTFFHRRSLFIVISFCFDLFFFAARISFLPCAFVSTATSRCSPSPESLSRNVLTCYHFVLVNVLLLSYSSPTPHHHPLKDDSSLVRKVTATRGVATFSTIWRPGWLSFPHILKFARMTSTHWPHQHFELLSLLPHPSNALFSTSGKVIKPNICRDLWAGYEEGRESAILAVY